MDNHEAYQGLLKRLEEKNCKESFNGYHAAYVNGTLVCFTRDLDYLKSIKVSDGSKIVYFKIGEDVMHEL